MKNAKLYQFFKNCNQVETKKNRKPIDICERKQKLKEKLN